MQVQINVNIMGGFRGGCFSQVVALCCKLAKYIMNLPVHWDFLKDRVVALHRVGALLGHKKGGFWLQVAGACSLQVQINVNVMGSFRGGCLGGGCLSRFDCSSSLIFDMCQ